MIVEIIHPQTKKVIKVNVDDLDMEKIKAINKPALSESALIRYIDNLSVSPETKTILLTVADITIKVGNTIVSIGRKILETILFFIKKYPNTAVGIIVGAIIGLLISSIPVIGWLLGWLILPLCTALGMALGFWKDMQDITLKQTIESAIQSGFSVLKNVPV